MHIITCDFCKDVKERVSSPYAIPSGFCKINVNVSGSKDGQMSRDACVECAEKILPESIDTKEKKETRLEHFIRDMVYEFVQDSISEGHM